MAEVSGIMKTRGWVIGPITLMAFVLIVLITIAMQATGTEVNESITADTTWDVGGSPYILTDSIMVDNGTVLTIEAGVEVHIPKGNAIEVDTTGRIYAYGTQENGILVKTYPSGIPPVVDRAFIKVVDDAILENVTFERVALQVRNNCRVSDCIVRFFETFDQDLPMIDVWGHDSTLLKCEVWNGEFGIYVADTDTDVTRDVRLIQCSAFGCEVGFQVSTDESVNGKITLIDCSATDCIEGFKIDTVGSDSVISDNLANNCDTGFIISSQERITLMRCYATSCTNAGFQTDNHDAHFVHSDFKWLVAKDCGVGIHLFFADKVLVYESTFRDNEVGIITNSASMVDTVIYENNIIDNGIQASIVSGNPTWYKFTRGNHWSDYAGTDGNSDGIGDTSYTVSGGHRDDYPLMDAIDNSPPRAEAGVRITAKQNEEFTLDGSLSVDDLAITSWDWTLFLPSGDVDLTGKRPTTSIGTIGVYRVTLTVTDGKGKKDSDTTWVHIMDSEPPAFVEVGIPEAAYTGEGLTITCRVTDNRHLSNVWITYWSGSFGNKVTVNMSRTGGDAWDYMVPVARVEIGPIFLKIGAMDQDNNINITDEMSVQVHDNVAPTIFQKLDSSTTSTGEPFHMNCSAIDNWQVDEVTVHWWFQGGQCNTATMESVAGLDPDYTFWIDIPMDDTAPLFVMFSAVDNAGNEASTEIYRVTVSDHVSPEVFDLLDVTTYHKGEDVEFRVAATDNIQVIAVFLETRYAGEENWTLTAMTRERADEYITLFNLRLTLAPSMEYRYYAEDADGNRGYTDPVEVTLFSPKPYITSQPPVDAWEGSEYRHEFTMEDLDGVPGEHTWTLESFVAWLVMDADTGILSGTPEGSNVGSVVVEVMVTDFDGGSNNLIFTITVHNVDLPPTVTIMEPVNGTLVEKTLRVTGRATDDDNRIEWVHARIDGGEWTTVSGDRSWTFVRDVKDLDPGVHTLEVKAFDGSNESIIESISFETKKPKDKDEDPGFGLALACAALTIGLILRRRRVR